jgi:hypothetical protein
VGLLHRQRPVRLLRTDGDQPDALLAQRRRAVLVGVQGEVALRAPGAAVADDRRLTAARDDGPPVNASLARVEASPKPRQTNDGAGRDDADKHHQTMAQASQDERNEESEVDR